MEAVEEKLFILDLLKLNKSEKMYSEESVINIIKQVLKMNQPVTAKTEQETNEQPKRVKYSIPFTSTSELCTCSNPDREIGYDYCNTCHKHVSPQRMELLTREIEHTNEQEKPSAEQSAYNKMKEQGFVSKDGVLNQMFEKPSESAEKILEEKWGKPQMDDTTYPNLFLKNKTLEAMEEYASQKHLPTDEEIEKEFPTDLRTLCTQLKIPESLWSSELSDALKSIQEGNLNKQIGAKAHRDNLIKKG